MQPIITIRDLAKHLGICRVSIDARIRTYGGNLNFKIINGRKHYKDGDLLRWHERCERIINGYSPRATQAIEEGAQAQFMGEPLSSNPYEYNSDICSYCAWAAGWHDAK